MALVDPRSYAGDGGADTGSDSAHADQRELIGRFRGLAAAGRDSEIAKALAAASTAAEYAGLWRALCSAVEKPEDADSVSPQLFAIPWVIVCGGSTAAAISCILSDIGELARAFEQNGVFGASRTVGLSNALCAIETLEGLAPSEVLHGWNSDRVREAAPFPISIERGVEKVHLRFLLGAAIAPRHAPGVIETGANINVWGTPVLRVMLKQLATSDAQVLPMPRPPLGLYTAAQSGRRAALETAFNLFMSNAVRRFRLTLGDPAVTLSSHEGGELRVTLWTPLDDSMVEGFRWPLHPADDFEDIERTIASLILECRLGEADIRSGILPDRTPTGAVLFPVGRREP